MNMTERSELLKKAVMTGVGASTSVDRIKTALDDAMRDLFKVGQGLMDDLEQEGKEKTEYVQDFLKKFQTEASKRSATVEKEVSTKVNTGLRKAARELGLVTQEDWEELCERLSDIEEAIGMVEEAEPGNGENPGQKRRKRKKNHG